MTPNRNARRGLLWVMAAAATLGVGLGAAGLASAASGSTSTTITSVADTSTVDTSTAGTVTVNGDKSLAPPADDGTRPDPASLPNGPGETVLTGDTAAKVTAAAEAAEPGATVIRVETDSSGHAYEAHVQLADGSYETLYFDESFVADGSEEGFGPAPAGMHGQHDGQRPQGQSPAGQTPTVPTDDSSTTTG